MLLSLYAVATYSIIVATQGIDPKYILVKIFMLIVWTVAVIYFLIQQLKVFKFRNFAKDFPGLMTPSKLRSLTTEKPWLTIEIDSCEEDFALITDIIPYNLKSELLITSDDDIDARCIYGIFSRPVVLSLGFVYIISQEERRAVIAHELGHSLYMDGLFSSISINLYWPLFITMSIFVLTFEVVFGWPAVVALFVLVYGVFPILIKKTRQLQETRADLFAASLGFAPILADYLEKTPKRLNIFQKIYLFFTANHPLSENRARLLRKY